MIVHVKSTKTEILSSVNVGGSSHSWGQSIDDLQRINGSLLLPARLGPLFVHAVRTLSTSGIANPQQEAAWLLEFALNITRISLQVDGDRILSQPERDHVLELIERRAGREPLQYILGTQEFYDLEFQVSPAVLIPRPETEMLVRQVVQSFRHVSDLKVADIGTGSGCIAIAIASQLPAANVWATDLSSNALPVGERNARRHGVYDRVRFLHGDLFDPLVRAGLSGQISVVVSNPPYIPDLAIEGLQPEVTREPRLALDGGRDGLDTIRRLLNDAALFVKPGGFLFMEIGEGQTEAVCDLADGTGAYMSTKVQLDARGIERIIAFERR
jgi:release factor glutamine methyltransferase